MKNTFRKNMRRFKTKNLNQQMIKIKTLIEQTDDASYDKIKAQALSKKKAGPSSGQPKHSMIQKQEMNKVDLNDIDPHSIEFEDIDPKDYPDFVDAFISYAEFKNGESLTDDQMDWLMDNEGEWAYDRLWDYLH